MPPPSGRAAQAHQPRSLGGDAVGGHKLLLLADGSQEAERVHAEADDANGHKRQQAERCGRRRLPALTPGRGGQDEERQQQARGQLHAYTRHERARTGAQVRGRARSHHQGERQGAQHERVVVRTADCQYEQHRIEPHECACPTSRVPEPCCRACDQGDRCEARDHGQRLQRPQPPGETQGDDCVAGQREQRAIGGVLKGPADKRIGGIREGFGGHMGVGIEAVQGAHASEGQISKDVLGDQRRPNQ